jgi:hypothetical protein
MSNNSVDSPIEDQEKLIKFILSKVSKSKQVEKVSSIRKEAHLRLRFNLDDGDTELEVLNRLISRSSTQTLQMFKSSKSYSDEYETNILKLIKTVENDEVSLGTKIYFVIADKNRKTEELNKNSKDLTPEKFRFSGEVLTEFELVSRVKQAFKNISSVSEVKGEVKQFCEDLLDQVQSQPPKNNSRVKIQSKVKDSIRQQDINLVAKNFGEILGSLWYMKSDSSSNKVEFPRSERNAVVDYMVHTSKNNNPFVQAISAKSGKGAPSAIAGILARKKTKIQKSKPRDTTSKSNKEFLLDLTEYKVKESIIYANRRLYTPAFMQLQKQIKFQMYDSVTTIVNKIDDYVAKKYLKKINKNNAESVRTTTDEFIEDFSVFFDLCPFTPNKQKVAKILASKSDGSSLFIYPLGRAAVNAMNGDESLVDYLNLVLKNSGIAQLTINLTNDDVKFTLYNDPRLNSSKGHYIFEYNSMYDNPGNRGFSFKLIPGR